MTPMSMSERLGDATLDTPEIRRLRLAVAEFLLGRSREEVDAVTVEVLALIEKAQAGAWNGCIPAGVPPAAPHS